MNEVQASARERRDRAKLIRYSSSELAQVAQHALACGRPVARYIRETSLGATPRARRAHASDTLIRQLARVATQLTTLARIAAKQGLDSASAFQSAVNDVLGTIREME